MVKKMAKKKTSEWEMKEPSDSFAWMTGAIEEAGQSKMFCVGGTLPETNPGLAVAGVGPVKLPLMPSMAKLLIAAARVAPFGKGTETLVDTKVRKTFEIDASQIKLSAAWDKTIEQVVSQVATDLGLADQQLRAELYKLLLYERGGHFQPHRDSEKIDRMVGSLVVMLPSYFNGGELVIQHENQQAAFSFENAKKELSPNYVAFYADCEHEVLKVTSGCRLCLTYNLIVGKSSVVKKEDADLDDATRLATSIKAHIAKHPTRPLVFALEHQYTQAGLTAELLKGADRGMADLIESAAKLADCRIYLAQVSRHLHQAAEERGSRRRDFWSSEKIEVSKLNIGETYEDDLHGKEWRDLSGETQAFGVIPFDTKSIVSKIPLDDWQPTSEEYEGYTGNAGNELKRWYHRSAIVLWHADNHYDVLAQGNLQDIVAMYFSMRQKLNATPEKEQQDEAKREYFRLTQAIIRCWPVRWHVRSSGESKDDRPWMRKFIETLPEFDDKLLHDAMLAAMQRDRATPMNKYLTTICHQYGVIPFAGRLKEMLEAPIGKPDDGIANRDLTWLSMLCCDPKLTASDRTFLASLCETTTQRFYGIFCDPKNMQYGDRALPELIKPLAALLQALLSTGQDLLAKKFVASFRAMPIRFDRDSVQIPCLLNLIPWSRKQLPPVLAQWFEAIRTELIAATSRSPQQPTNWTRPAKIEGTYGMFGVSSRYNTQLNKFLADPKTETLTILAAESERNEIIRTVNTHQCDVTHRLEKKGNRYQLVLTKTLGSYERAVKQYADDLKLLAALADHVVGM